jgi:magnesium transporter
MSSNPAPFDFSPETETVPDKHARLTSFYQTREGGVKTRMTPTEIVKAVQSGEGRIWVDVDCQHTTEWLALAQTLGFHPLTVEDTLSPESRLKLEEYDGYLFVVARDLSFNTVTDDPYDFDTCNIYLFLSKSYLFTVHSSPSRTIETVRERLTIAPELMDRGVDYLAYAVLDTMIDSYFPMLDQIDNFIDELETSIFEQKDAKTTLTNVFDLKRTLLALRRHQGPTREILATMANRPSPYIQPQTQTYFRDVYDHVVRQVESIENFRDMLTGALDIHYSVSTSRTNEIMKALTIAGTFLLPATWIASIYGMNFEWMPFLHDPHGFWIAMLLMFGVSFMLMIYLKTRKWM